MPELPEVETTRAALVPRLEGHAVRAAHIYQAQLRVRVPDNFASALNKQTVQRISRRGKYLLFHFAKVTMLIHLGMSGRLRVLDKVSARGKHDHVDIHFNNGCVLRYTDPRRFGLVTVIEGDPYQHKLLSRLGPEPLSSEFNLIYLFNRAKKRDVSIKQFIMNGEIVVGVGNIYANEALFLAGIHPQRPCANISKDRFAVLIDKIKLVLQKAIEKGGTTLKDFYSSDGSPGYFQQQLFVYGRAEQECLVCKKIIAVTRISARSTFYCPQCQR